MVGFGAVFGMVGFGAVFGMVGFGAVSGVAGFGAVSAGGGGRLWCILERILRRNPLIKVKLISERQWLPIVLCQDFC